MKSLLTAMLALSFLVLPGLTTAEDFQENVGFAPGHMFEMGQFGESVDVTNGNMTLSVPIGPQFKLNDLSYGVTLTYNSKFWAYASGDVVGDMEPYLKQNDQSQFGLGWTFHGGRLFLDDPNIPYYDAAQEYLDAGGMVANPYYNNAVPPPKPLRIQYERADGSRTVLYADNRLDPLSDYFYSQDSTYLRAKAYIVHEDNDPAKDEMLVWKVWQPDGTTIILGYQVGTGRQMTRHKDWKSQFVTFAEGAFLVAPNQTKTSYSLRSGGVVDLTPHDAEYGWYASRKESSRKFISTSSCDGSALTAPKLLELPGDEELVPCTYVEYFYDWPTGTPVGQHNLPKRVPTDFGVLNFIQDSLGRRIEIRNDAVKYFSLGQEVTYTLGFTGVPDPVGNPDKVEPHMGQKLTRADDDRCSWDDPNDSGNLGMNHPPFLTQIGYPLGYTMDFEYKDPSCTGVMSARVLPTGARAEYEYLVYPYNYDKSAGLSLVRRRHLVNGQDPAVWQYVRDPTQAITLGYKVTLEDTTLPTGIKNVVYFSKGSELPVGAGAGSSNTADFSNPPRVFEIDPDGNMVVYYHHYECTSADAELYCGKYSRDLLGRTWMMLRVRGQSDSTFITKEEYQYENDGIYDQPYDIDPITLIDPAPAANLRRSATKSFVYDHLGNTLSRWTKQSDYEGYGKYGKTVEYEPESESAVYRTTETSYTFDTANWILGLGNAATVRGGLSGPEVSKSEVTSRDDWGLPLVSRVYPDPAGSAGMYVETTNQYNDKGALEATSVKNVGAGFGAFAGVGRETHFTVDDKGRVLHKTFGDPTTGDLTWKAFEKVYDATTDLVTKTITPAGIETQYQYDDLGRLTRILPGNGEYDTTISYPSLAETIVSQGLSIDLVEAHYRYDQSGRLVRHEKHGFNFLLNAQDTRYDIVGRKVFESEWMPVSASQPWPGTSFEYWVPVSGPAGPVDVGAGSSTYIADPQGRMTRIIGTDGAVTETTYGMLTRTVTVKDLNRLPGSSTIPSEGPVETTTVFTNDVFGRLVHVDAAEGDDASYQYDLLDNLARVDMGSQVRTFDYDGLGRLLSSSNPENGLVTFGGYDPAGLVLEKNDAAQAVTSYVYDDAGRILSATRTMTGQVLQEYQYDAFDPLDPDLYAGQLVSVQNYREDPYYVLGSTANEKTARRDFQYAGLNGRLSVDSLFLGDTTDELATNYSYNTMGQLSNVTYPSPSWGGHTPTQVSYTYSRGFLSKVGDGVVDDAFVSLITYNPGGGQQMIRYANGTETEALPDLRNRPERVIVRVPDPTYAMAEPSMTEPLSGKALQIASGGAWSDPRSVAPLQQVWAARSHGPETLIWPKALPSDLLAQVVLPGTGNMPLGSKGVPAWRSINPLPADMLAQEIEVCPDPPVEGAPPCGGGGGGGGGGTGPVPVIDTWDSGLYSYDGAGNIISIGPDVMFDGTTTTTAPLPDVFAYDALSRLTGASLYNLPGNSAGSMSTAYTYDGFGNMLSRSRSTATSTSTWSFTHDGANHIQQSTSDETGPLETRTFTYDDVGNLASVHALSSEVDNVTIYDFDPQGRLTQINRDSAVLGRYGYDDRGYRFSKTESGVETIYVRDTGGRVLSEFRRIEGIGTDPVWDKDYVYAAGGAIAVVKNQDPQPPTGFVTTWKSQGQMKVDLAWDKSTEDDIAGYKVYWDDLGDPNTSPAAIIEVGTLTVVHDGALPDLVEYQHIVPQGKHEYYVVSVDTAGYVSGESRHFVVWDNDPDYETVDWGNPAIEEGDRQLTLHWSVTAEKALHIIGYNVYRLGNSGYALINPEGLLKQPGLIDTGESPREYRRPFQLSPAAMAGTSVTR